MKLKRIGLLHTTLWDDAVIMTVVERHPNLPPKEIARLLHFDIHRIYRALRRAERLQRSKVYRRHVSTLSRFAAY